MKTTFSIAELDRVVKFTNEFNQLAHKYTVGISSYETINLSVDSKIAPFILDEDDDGNLSLVVSL